MIKLILIEDNSDLREELKALIKLSKKLSCIDSFSSMEAFLRNPGINAPDIVLLDIGLPGMSGISGIPKIKELFPNTEIVILTAYNDPDKVFRAICSGASGYLLKDINFDYLEAELVALQEKGGSPISPQIARRILNYFQKSKIKRQPHSVKLREKEYIIVRALVDGLSYEETGIQMGITIDGVRYHIKNIYKKLQVHSKGQVIRKYLDGEIDGLLN